MDAVLATVLQNQEVKPGFFQMECLAPEISKECKPGQFLMIKPNQLNSPLLGRPMGIFDWDVEKGTIQILYEVKGPHTGTELLSLVKPGEVLPVVAPLGNGYWFREEDKKVLVVAGGIGIAPLFPVVKALKARNIQVTVLLGAPKAERLLAMQKLAALEQEIMVFTDDGSVGEMGYPTDRLPQLLRENAYDCVYCCGSMAMMQRVAEICEAANVPCQVSLEKRMGCGFGVCMGCVCQQKQADGSKELVRICYEGPVFAGKDVVWEEE